MPSERTKEIRELLCMVCDREYPVWFAANELWNRVVRRPDGSDEWHFLCPTCFALIARSRGVDTPFMMADGQAAVGSRAFAELQVAAAERLRGERGGAVTLRSGAGSSTM